MPIGSSSRTPAATATSSYVICCKPGASHRHQRNPAIPFPHHGDKRSGDGGVELRSRSALDVSHRPLRLPGLTVGPIGPKSIVDVADVYQTACVLSASRVVQSGIASAVDHDVMLVRHDSREVHRVRTRQKHSSSYYRMVPDNVPFRVVELPRLDENVPRDTHLAQVVQEPRHPECSNGGSAQLQKLTQGHGEHRYVHRVGCGILVKLLQLKEWEDHRLLGVHGNGERADNRVGLNHRQLGPALDFLM